MPYPKPGCGYYLTIPFKIFYWRFVWKPVDYDLPPKVGRKKARKGVKRA